VLPHADRDDLDTPRVVELLEEEDEHWNGRVVVVGGHEHVPVHPRGLFRRVLAPALGVVVGFAARALTLLVVAAPARRVW
jgi:hypothetical protein